MARSSGPAAASASQRDFMRCMGDGHQWPAAAGAAHRPGKFTTLPLCDFGSIVTAPPAPKLPGARADDRCARG